jgi:hypothetical protein
MTAEQAGFLRAHRLAALATGRWDGSPQVSTMGVLFDGHIVMPVTTEPAKWHNVCPQPRVVNEAQRQLVLYGRAERVATDPGRPNTTRAAQRDVSPRRPRALHGVNAQIARKFTEQIVCGLSLRHIARVIAIIGQV